MLAKLNPHISFKGNCEQAFCFYQAIFGGEFSKLERYGELQKESGAPASPEEFGYQIRHIELALGNNVTLMGSDNANISRNSLNMGDNVKICIILDDKEEAHRIFGALSAGGSVKKPLAKSFWGSLYGSLTDKFGVHWMVEVQLATNNAAFEDNANIHIP